MSAMEGRGTMCATNQDSFHLGHFLKQRKPAHMEISNDAGCLQLLSRTISPKTLHSPIVYA